MTTGSLNFTVLIMVCLIAWKVACEQGLRGTLASGREKEGEFATHLWNLNICMEKVNAKCWLAEMTLVMTSLPLVRAFTRFSMFVWFLLVSASRWLAEIWQLSRRGATGELEVEFKFQRRSCKLSFLFPPRRQSAPEILLAGFMKSSGLLLSNLRETTHTVLKTLFC